MNGRTARKASAGPGAGLEPAPDHRHAGLCARCLHLRRTENDRGSVFYRCDYARRDPGYPKYPVLPVLSCAAFARRG